VGNGAPLLRDPNGLFQEQATQHGPTKQVDELKKILPQFIEKLKDAAKNSKNIERFGVILKAKDSSAKPKYRFVEEIPKQRHPKKSDHSWWIPAGSDGKQRGGVMLKPDDKGEAHTDQKEVRGSDLDTRYPIEYGWHTHPVQLGDPWPSARDKENAKKNNIVEIMIIYIPRLRLGKTIDDWAVWIVDENGNEHEYKGPGCEWPRPK